MKKNKGDALFETKTKSTNINGTFEANKIISF